MNATTQQALTSYIHKSCGITLGPEKAYLLEQRLIPLLPELGFADLDRLATQLASSQSQNSSVREKIIVAITTNETSFFRDETPWAALQEAFLPELCLRIQDRKARVPQRRGAKARIWSAACSTGQEPYTLAITIQEYLRSHPRELARADDFEIVATDISSRVLSKALLGRYSSIELARGIIPAMRKQYFEAQGNDMFQANADLRRMIDFRSLNLMNDFSHLGAFDAIFCRNVLIYFDEPAKQKILATMHSMLDPKGILVLGSAENLYGLKSGYQSVHVSGSVHYRLIDDK